MTWQEKQHEKRDVMGFVSFGFFLLLIGVIWIVTPNLSQEVIDFFDSFKAEKEIFPNVFLPVPRGLHPIVYTALARFCFVFGLSQMVILGLRFFFRENLERMAGTFSGVVFWLGMGFVSNMLADGAIEWFGFLGLLIVFIGLSIVVRSLLILLFEVALRKG